MLNHQVPPLYQKAKAKMVKPRSTHDEAVRWESSLAYVPARLLSIDYAKRQLIPMATLLHHTL